MSLWLGLLSVARIAVLYQFHKNGLMPLTIYKNEKHLITLYNVIFSNMTGILTFELYLLLTQEGSNVSLK